MDEIWENIDSTTNLVSQKGIIDFQDFLSPINQKRQPISSCPCSSHSNDTANEANFPSPATVLSLKSPQDVQFPATPVFPGSNQPNPSMVSPFNAGLDGLVTSSGFPDFIENHKSSGIGGGGGGEQSIGDRRFKRMMMNRASAARSRRRKQAYTYELEDEVAQVKEENAKLRIQIDKLLVDAQAAKDQVPIKLTLTRTLSTPF